MEHKKGAKKISLRQEAMCQEYMTNGGNKSQAWIKAFKKEHVAKTTAYTNSQEAFRSPLVVARLKELKAEIKDKYDLKVDDIIEMLFEDRELAKTLGSAAASVSAAMGMAKVAGLLVDKVDNTSSDGSMATPTVIKIVSVDNV